MDKYKNSKLLMSNEILRDLSFASTNEYQQKREHLLRNQDKLKDAIGFWVMVLTFAVVVVLQVPDIPLLLVSFFLMPLFSVLNQVRQYDKAIKHLDADALEHGIEPSADS